MQSKNINGYCPECNYDFDGELIIDSFIEAGKTQEEALEIAKMYSGWTLHKEANRWSKRVNIYSLEVDRSLEHYCTNCSHRWDIE